MTHEKEQQTSIQYRVTAESGEGRQVSIWVDADACPVVIKEIIFRAANRTQTMTTLVANSFIKVPPSKHINFLQVPKGFDVADNEIVKRAQGYDLVITADIPLAAEIVEMGATALNPRGERYTPENVRQRLNMRDFMDTMRSSGVHTGGPPPLSQTDRQKFANALDKYLAQESSR
ncbi:MAG: YaiI/YqxD family protein [Gammaproteobacteria bacterium]|jgi:uncharacterized protein|nr:YaiI/YqxD family protein [Gammaproteobacteria bacterium]MBT4491675.1 YaiI/YqxD family protein [Gammaproteobacteria bacterium]MBT7370768.1 YaiI/YqxD family protein [Gammaproteobacteria bacterium]